MIKALIIDDEELVRNDIRIKINNFYKSDIVILGEAESIKDSINIIKKHQPDLLFLDIELKDGDSFELLERLSTTDFQIIFITGFNEHAIKAIKVGALDYILKPIDDDEFKQAVNKAILMIHKEDSIEQFINVSSDYFKGIKNKRIVLKTSEAYHIVYEDDILYCNSEGNYTTFYMNDTKKILISKSIKKVEELVSETTFIKCHQSYLVNLNYIEKYIREGYLILKNNVKIPISSRRKDFVLKKLNDV